MTDTVTVAMISSLPGILTALGGLLLILRRIRGVHDDINSRMDQLLVSEKAISHAEGIQQERGNGHPIPEVKP